MMPVTTMVLHPVRGPLVGRPALPGDKSVSHRALLLGALATAPWSLRGLSPARDVASTAEALICLGATVRVESEFVRVQGPATGWRDGRTLDCGNSGSTARMLLGFLAGTGVSARLEGDSSLSLRPMARVLEPLAAWGLEIAEGKGHLPLLVRSRPRPATCTVELPVASAQVKTALALAVLHAGGRLDLREPHASRDHTERMLEALGAPLERTSGGFTLGGPWRPPGHTIDIPGDPSAAAFWGVAAALVPGSRLVLGPISLNPGRTGWIRVLRRMGCPVNVGASRGHDPVGSVTVDAPASLQAVTVEGEDLVQALDEMPVLAVAMARATGTSFIRGARELRVKESDRLQAIATMLASFGIDTTMSADDLAIHGRGPGEAFRIGNAPVASHGDHRIAMAAGIASLVAAGPVTLADPEVAGVSDPRFWETRRAIMAS